MPFRSIKGNYRRKRSRKKTNKRKISRSKIRRRKSPRLDGTFFNWLFRTPQNSISIEVPITEKSPIFTPFPI